MNTADAGKGANRAPAGRGNTLTSRTPGGGGGPGLANPFVPIFAVAPPSSA